MQYFSILIPAIFIALVLFLAVIAFHALSKASLPGEELGGENSSMKRKDRLLAWGITLIYSCVAFFMLGNTSSFESYYQPSAGECVYFELEDGAQLAEVRWYAGIRVGTWNMRFSADGENWSDVTVLDQNYVSVLKWNTQELGLPAMDYKYVELTSASGAPEIGELALYDAEGQYIAPLAGSTTGCEALFDEAEKIPEEQSFLNSSYFDEIYHARTAWEGLRGETIYETTHPPLGKLLISVGILLFGMNPFGWRFVGTLCGALMLPVLYAFVKKLFGQRDVAVCCTLVFAFDFMHFTQTRIATIDTYSVLFILLMYYFLYCFLHDDMGTKRKRNLFLAGLFWGLGAASKWTCIYAGAGMGVLWLISWILHPEFLHRAFWKNVGWCLLFFVLMPVTIYYLSYWPYGHAAGLSWPRMWFSKEYLKLVLHNQQYMWSYHSSLVATHPYSSKWWQWLLDIRPILYFLQYFEDGKKSAIAAFTSPLLCWGGLLSLFGTLCIGIRTRDKRALFVLVGYLAQLLPWVLVTRLTFAYHYFPSEVFLLLSLGYNFAALKKAGNRHVMLAFTAACGVLFVLFYPVLSGMPAATAYTSNILQWFPTWPV